MSGKKSSGQVMWEGAISMIPGGNGLLSKRPGRYVPGLWPAYYSHAKGVTVWDLDGRSYVDMAQMGIGCAILGYAHDEVNAAVKEAVDKAVSTTLNAPEEVMLAECLLSLNPFAGGVRFARTGGEAMAMAVRIARAYSGKSQVAFSGYHGWSDWYLAANLNDNNDGLSEHLLPGLSPLGVPSGLKNSAFPFPYNDLLALEVLLSTNDIGVIVLEGARYDFPTPDFIAGINRLAKQYQCVLVLDEITSGWRLTDGGVYKLNGFNPDIVVYGKAMGNGFAISAVVGEKSVMDVAQDTFISSTFWTERVGFVAALATIKVLMREKVWEHLAEIGDYISAGWLRLAQQTGVKLSVSEFKPLITMMFGYGDDNDAVSTYFAQEMLEKGYLVANSVYVSHAHTKAIVDAYLVEVEKVFQRIANHMEAGTIVQHLKNGVRQQGFSRLT